MLETLDCKNCAVQVQELCKLQMDMPDFMAANTADPLQSA